MMKNILFSNSIKKSISTKFFLENTVFVNNSSFIPQFTGNLGTLEYRVHFKDSNKVISPFHDIALWNNEAKKEFNFVCEMPKGSKEKMEVSLKEKNNPILQDTKKGKLRYITHGSVPWNYGMIPQTYEDPNVVDQATQLKGDGDPLDVIEIGSKTQEIGTISGVKAVGAFGLIDEGELDWKIICINNNDPKYDLINDISDVEKEYPTLLHTISNWYKVYKVADGKPENKYAYGGRCLSRKETFNIIKEAHESWISNKDKLI